MTSVYFSKKPGAWFASLEANLNTHDSVIASTPSREDPKPVDLSHLRPDKRIRGN